MDEECSPLFEMSTLRQSVIDCPNNNHKCPVSVGLTCIFYIYIIFFQLHKKINIRKSAHFHTLI